MGIKSSYAASGPSLTAQHTSTAAETSYTAVTATAPKSAKWKKAIITGTVSGDVYLQGAGQTQYHAPVTPNVANEIDLSQIPEATSIIVNFELDAVGTSRVTIYYQ